MTYLTRRQAADFIRDELGRPMSFSTAAKLAALGEFAEPVVWWGRRPLYTRDDLRAWAEARSRPTKERAVPQSTNRVTEDREEGASPRNALLLERRLHFSQGQAGRGAHVLKTTRAEGSSPSCSTDQRVSATFRQDAE